ncbi:hypothetical protein E2C01_075742 [Portunus trituberculatus]|uniref:Uncharacterized protein n=1 Tax=Portunus trituberculatus TaxID=210409 RepID=A0A5B7I6V8_PORTR|nr:hypothetical protein [Portunus trituberculatus]
MMGGVLCPPQLVPASAFRLPRLFPHPRHAARRYTTPPPQSRQHACTNPSTLHNAFQDRHSPSLWGWRSTGRNDSNTGRVATATRPPPGIELRRLRDARGTPSLRGGVLPPATRPATAVLAPHSSSVTEYCNLM